MKCIQQVTIVSLVNLSFLHISVTHRSHGKAEGVVLACGEGDVGQLGLGPDVMERMRAGFVRIPDPIIQICAGGMHTVCLTNKGQVCVRCFIVSCLEKA